MLNTVKFWCWAIKQTFWDGLPYVLGFIAAMMILMFLFKNDRVSAQTIPFVTVPKQVDCAPTSYIKELFTRKNYQAGAIFSNKDGDIHIHIVIWFPYQSEKDRSVVVTETFLLPKSGSITCLVAGGDNYQRPSSDPEELWNMIAPPTVETRR